MYKDIDNVVSSYSNIYVDWKQVLNRSVLHYLLANWKINTGTSIVTVSYHFNEP